ncbi:hypothetical protein SFA35_17780 [Pseudomonas sp. HR96]|uniref:hypothetical protein n=1 Tax=Pseudomonas sp. HR96 TaxID=1027966 RepID=UPI002A7539E8|nr:hypothetical protein [Pseudomonas sp. HR96]WPO98473.1 hypothetical protein SFA35_17780 [Pseudomonas sp. HR96]
MPETCVVPPLTAVLFGLSDCLVDSQGQLTAGAGQGLEHLHEQKVPCVWLDQLQAGLVEQRTARLPDWLAGCNAAPEQPRWPSAQACWRALLVVGAARLDGCLLVSGDRLLLQSALAAGLWTVGLASNGAREGLSDSQWLALDPHARDLKRGKATMALFELGVHSVIDHLEELGSCLQDVGQRRLKGEKP